jgi:hypothetical protein
MNFKQKNHDKNEMLGMSAFFFFFQQNCHIFFRQKIGGFFFFFFFFFGSSVNDINLAIFLEMEIFFGQFFNIKKWKKIEKENLI